MLENLIGSFAFNANGIYFLVLAIWFAGVARQPMTICNSCLPNLLNQGWIGNISAITC